MGRQMRVAATSLILIAGWAACDMALANPDMARKEKAPCALCHVNPAGGSDLSDVGAAYKDKKAIPQDAAPVPDDKQANYIGAQNCRLCHMKEHKSWEQTPHATAFKVLESKKADNNAACITCHSTGAALPGGYSHGTDQAEELKQVTCEACHGPGSLHAKAAKDHKKEVINGSPGEVLCKSCHIPRFSPKFEYVEWVKKGVHALPPKQQTQSEVSR